MKFANHFIIYQKRPFRGRFGTGRLHSELWAWGVKKSLLYLIYFKADVEAFYNEEIDPYDLVFEFYNNLERDFPTLDLLFRFPNRPDNWNEIGKSLTVRPL